MSDEPIISIRLPEAILELVDATVKARLYKNRTEVLREIIRNGVNQLMYRGRGGFCHDLGKMVDCCHDEQCKYCNGCEVFDQR
ncbi:MAG: ribbon-helix-helix domain-containing protein [Candidatus Altiarchaeota archaeon]|nr:ribbon-helix-helix domain-containing protein [Candidatus Altiarchaeota archaeon]